MFCAYCGVKLDSEARFCGSCGNATVADPVAQTGLEIQEPERQETHPPPQSKTPPVYYPPQPGATQETHPPPQSKTPPAYYPSQPEAYNIPQPQTQFKPQAQPQNQYQPQRQPQNQYQPQRQPQNQYQPQPQFHPQATPYAHPTKKSGKPRNKTRLAIILSAGGVVLIAAVVLAVYFITSVSSYNNAVELMAGGDYQEAQDIFVDLGRFRDASELADECQNIMDYNAALQLMDRGRYGEAKAAFEALSPFRDSDVKAAECQTAMDYETAVGIMASGDYEQAQGLFAELGTYRDSASLFIECGNWIVHGEAVVLMSESRYADAIVKLEPLVEQGFADSATLLIECENWIIYGEALALMDSGRYDDALVTLETLTAQGFEDSAMLVLECYNNITYIEAVSAFDDGMFYTAFRLFSSLGNFKDSVEMAGLCAQEYPSTGELYRNSDYSGTAVPIRIRTPGDDPRPTLLKIYTEDDILVASLFINSGDSHRIRLPAGTYIIKQAYGLNWYGEEEMFGDEGAIYEVLVFPNVGVAYNFRRNYTYELTLRSAVDGNVNTLPEGRGSF